MLTDKELGSVLMGTHDHHNKTELNAVAIEAMGKAARAMLAPPAADELVQVRADISLRCQVVEALGRVMMHDCALVISPGTAKEAEDQLVTLRALLEKERTLLAAQKAGGEPEAGR